MKISVITLIVAALRYTGANQAYPDLEEPAWMRQDQPLPSYPDLEEPTWMNKD